MKVVLDVAVVGVAPRFERHHHHCYPEMTVDARWDGRCSWAKRDVDFDGLETHHSQLTEPPALVVVVVVVAPGVPWLLHVVLALLAVVGFSLVA